MTDEAPMYTFIGREFAGGHGVVDHHRREYVRGDAYTNTAEGFFSLLKRGINGVYHHVGRGHLDRYCDEFSFRYNRREVTGGERSAMLVTRFVMPKRERTSGLLPPIRANFKDAVRALLNTPAAPDTVKGSRLLKPRVAAKRQTARKRTTTKKAR